jgi:putative acetyltransferase
VQIRPADLTDERVLALLRAHLAGMRANTPAGHVFALDLTGLRSPDIALWTVWDGESVLAIGALKELGPGAGEIKSMRTDPRHLRRGAASALLAHLLDQARERGYHRVSLETGRGPEFEPALALYRRHGFASGGAFGDYAASQFNQFLHLELAGAS